MTGLQQQGIGWVALAIGIGAAVSGCIDERCYENAHCTPPKVCSPEGICVWRCVEDPDCGQGFICRDHVCVPGGTNPDAIVGDAGEDAVTPIPVCPDDMVLVLGTFCIDIYEASRPDATATNAGRDESRAVSTVGVMPWRVDDNNPKAQAACEAAGKRLCSPSEWETACRGPDETVYGYGNTYNKAICNALDTYPNTWRLEPTGHFPACTNEFGVFDMNGNLWEHTLDGSGMTVRGGAYNCNNPENLHRCTYVPGNWVPAALGFRCCRAPDWVIPGEDAWQDVAAPDVPPQELPPTDLPPADAPDPGDTTGESGCVDPPDMGPIDFGPWDPGGTDPGWDPGFDPGTDPGATDPGHDPGYDPGWDPGFDPGTDAGHDPGHDPGATDPGPTDPGFDPGTDPGVTDPGFDPGVDPGFDPGTDEGLDPGLDPGVSDPGFDPGTDEGHDPGFDPGTDPGPPPPACPDGMVRIRPNLAEPGWCMDRYEASRADATSSWGGSSNVATSRPGVRPWIHISDDYPVNLPVAQAACEAAGKRLCETEEWVPACTGTANTNYVYGDTYDLAACNGIDTYCYCGAGTACADVATCPYPHCYRYTDSACIAEFGTTGACGPCRASFRCMPTGSFPTCVNEWGAYDLCGNVWELVIRRDQFGGASPRYRGGAFNCSDSEWLHRCDTEMLETQVNVKGFRCCKDVTLP